jgi:hypothetical protein
MEPIMKVPTKCPEAMLAVALTLCCSLAAAQSTAPSTSSTPAPQSNPTPASQSNPTPAAQPNATPAAQPNPTPASQSTPTATSTPTPTSTANPANAATPNARNMDRPTAQQQFPATQQNTNQNTGTIGSPSQNAAAMRCASLTGIPKAECERRDSPDTDLPAGRTKGQVQRELQRQAEAERRATPPQQSNR